MKKTKRNVAIIVVLLFVCAAVYFNWSYNAQWGRRRNGRCRGRCHGGGQCGRGDRRGLGVDR